MLVHLGHPALWDPEEDNVNEFVVRQTLIIAERRKLRNLLVVQSHDVVDIRASGHVSRLSHVTAHVPFLLFQSLVWTEGLDNLTETGLDHDFRDNRPRHSITGSLDASVIVFIRLTSIARTDSVLRLLHEVVVL